MKNLEVKPSCGRKVGMGRQKGVKDEQRGVRCGD
jgi:hypothetical protein